MFRFSVIGIFLILLVGAMYFAKGFLLPVMVAFLLALILSPVVRQLQRYHIPDAMSAIGLVLVLTLGLAGLTWTLSGPISKIMDDAPRIGDELRYKLSALVKPIETVKEVEKSIKDATESPAKTDVQEVVVSEPGLISKAVKGAPEILVGIGFSLTLLLFLLASGNLFYEKLVRSMPTMHDKKRWLRIVYDVEHEVSRYLFAISLVNLGLGVCIAAGLYFVGASEPLLWGVGAMLLNFIPYIGPLVGIVTLAIVSVVEYPTLIGALMPPLIYAALNIIEGQFITPVLVGRRLQLNAVVIFLAIAFWGWLWGIVGVLIAVPILITVKTFAHHADGMVALKEFLGVRASPTESEINREKSKLSA